MANTLELRGIIPAMITPFTPLGEAIDTSALRALTARLISAGCVGLIPGGSTGEFSALSNVERRLLHETVLSEADGRIPVVAQTGALSTAEAIELSLHAQDHGAAAVMVVPPFYEGLSFREIKTYYSEVAGAISVPVMLYHIPELSGVHLSVEQFVELSEIPGVELVKDSSANASAMFQLARTKRLQVCNGWDTLVFSSLASGDISAVVWGAACIFPEQAVALYEAVAVRRNLAEGADLWRKLFPLVSFLESGDYNARVKAAVGMTGLRTGPSRRPILPIGDADRNALAGYLTDLDIPLVPAGGAGSNVSLTEVSS